AAAARSEAGAKAARRAGAGTREGEAPALSAGAAAQRPRPLSLSLARFGPNSFTEFFASSESSSGKYSPSHFVSVPFSNQTVMFLTTGLPVRPMRRVAT